jgi:hypothetical protein
MDNVYRVFQRGEDPKTGEVVTIFLDGGTTWSPADFIAYFASHRSDAKQRQFL